MCRGWLRKRAHSARFVAVAALSGHALRFHKKSRDGSGKADAYPTDRSNDVVWGVVFEIDAADKGKLDAAEGLGKGYGERTVKVSEPSGASHRVVMYVAEGQAIDRSLCPYTWYRDLMVAGAQAQDLPAEYVRRLEAVEVWEDPDPGRGAKARGLEC
jgi:gamma-glutamylcyclotransferase